MVLLAVVPYLQPAPGQITLAQSEQLQSMLWINGFTAIIALPSFWYALTKLRGKQIPFVERKYFLASSVGLGLCPVIFWLGFQAATNHWLVWATAPLNIFAILLPLWWFMEVGRRNLDQNGGQRNWGMVNFSAFISMPIIILVEIILLGIALAFGILWLIQQPEFAPVFQLLQSQAASDPQVIESMLQDLLPIIQRPGWITAGFIGISLIIPLVEELLKPLALWFLIKRKIAPAQGFTAGLLCGATFALLESLYAIIAVSADTWLITAIGRVGTGLLHILTTGLTGWALASSWQDGKYLRIGLTFTTSVLIHGVWNFFALLMGIGQTLTQLPFEASKPSSVAAPWILVMIAGWMFALLIQINRKLQSGKTPPSLPSSTQERMG